MTQTGKGLLVMIQGEEKGAQYPLAEMTTIGRGSFNTIKLREPKASRRHALIQRSGTQFILRDLDSGNGTYVNSKAIKQAVLNDGDIIQIAEAVFIFRSGEAPKSLTTRTKTAPAAVIGSPSMVESTQAELKFDAQRSFLLSPEEKMPVEELAKANAKLRTLYYVNNAISSIRDLKKLLKVILEIVFEEIPAERGAILLYDEHNQLKSAVTHVREPQKGEIVISQTIIKRVTSEKISILSKDTLSDDRFVQAQSIISQGIASSMSVPLISKENLLGVLYIDSTRSTTHFNEDNLELLTGIAGQAAVAIENALLIERIERETETRTHLQRYLAPELVEQVVQKKINFSIGGELIKATILYSDLRGFTSITETLGSEAIVTILNEYFTRMVDIVFLHRGILDKFIGDCIMASWGIPIVRPDDALSAIKAALQMQRELFYFNARQQHLGKTIFKMGIGINTGEVVSGNMGSPKRMEYTVIGRPVNLAARLQSLAAKNQILISDNTYQEVGERLWAVQLEPAFLKGIKRKVGVFCILGVRCEDPLYFLPVQVRLPGQETAYEGLILSWQADEIMMDVMNIPDLCNDMLLQVSLDIPQTFSPTPFELRVKSFKSYVRLEHEFLSRVHAVGQAPPLQELWAQLKGNSSLPPSS